MKNKYLIGAAGLILLILSFKINDFMENPTSTTAVQYRIARPTDQLVKVTSFYENALGLKRIGAFKEHDGYDGVMLGLPGSGYHLEFTQHKNGSPCPAPTKDNLLVLYFDDPMRYRAAVERMQQYGTKPVKPENSYWENKSETYEDPDGWRVVLFNGTFKPGLKDEN